MYAMGLQTLFFFLLDTVRHLSFQEPGSKNQQVVFLVHFWKMYHVLPDLELFDNSHSLGSIQWHSEPLGDTPKQSEVLASMPLPTPMMKASWHTYSNLGEL